MITETEIQTGVKASKRNLTDDEIAAIPQVAEEVEKSSGFHVLSLIRTGIENLKQASMMFFTAIIKTVNKLPYGLRWICKMVTDAALVARSCFYN